jgi:hypothetical protein
MAPPIITPCTAARSPLSANISRNTNTAAALTNSTAHNAAGITPSAPWMRSPRAVSRSARWSRYLEKAACSDGERGSAVPRLRKTATPQGLGASPSVPDCIRGHSRCTTARA